ncbi:HAD-IIB family hydrolase [Limnohabitans sp. Hippo3]|uniref:HAD-IIB family hydrolase n=1 Tax=Limnohabitans sp. Hippo3 TaxID=1597956 RepID=UPI000D333EE3|nr:HAD-IIB family hydrolase [Limnohabitans sp. Hippo3]PUE37103.1 HAD family hydrolase [Limnohabitans sp. Hippo3]
MQLLRHWSPGHIVGVFTDIDDTLTTEGEITSDAFQALADLKLAGLHVVPITGRPVGWSEPFAQSWPVDAIVAENGAVGLQHSTTQGLRKLYQQDARTRQAHFTRMQAVLDQIEKEVTGARRSQDSAGRETDIAIDHSEFTQLPQSAIDEVVRVMQGAGMTATVSSIHINGWFGTHSKLTGARWIVREVWGRDLDAEIDRWVYVGDSTNDQVMFEHFPHSVGVANIRRFEAQLTHPPRYITPSERGAGFAEMTRHLLARLS